MQDAPESKSASKFLRSPFSSSLPSTALVLHGIKIALLIGLIAFLSKRFDLSQDANGNYLMPFNHRPILEVIFCFVAAFWLYIEAILVARKIPDSFRLSVTIVGFAVLFRLLMFVSTPIQEVDIYRYIWDGIVLSEGISPFKYSPLQVRSTAPESEADPDLKKLALRYRQQLRQTRQFSAKDPGHGTADALNLVHFGQVPTVYPPVSQVVFGAAALTTPEDASLLTRLRIMKGWLLIFDLGTVVVLICLLRSLSMSTAYSIAYAWCPLVLKEIGNSGHLDSIAIFLTTMAVFLFVRCVMLPSSFGSIQKNGKKIDQNTAGDTPLDTDRQTTERRRPSVLGSLLPVLFLALAIGAKIYAIVLAPLFVFVAIKRLGWQATILPALAFIALTTLACWPMIPDSSSQRTADQSQLITEAERQKAKQEKEKETGLAIFLKYWEMNDFVFMNIVENLKPPSLESRKDPWFSVFPEPPREKLSEFVVDNFLTTDEHETEEEAKEERRIARGIAPFVATRFLLTMVFFLVAIALAVWATMQNHSHAFCRAAFLTLAWFWLLAPTQNPWYWLWALPLIPFAKNRTWYLMSGILFIYYVRFWIEYHFTGLSVTDSLEITSPESPGMLSSYRGVDFFDFVITWFEYLPWYLLLSIETLWCLLFRSTPAIADETNV